MMLESNIIARSSFVSGTRERLKLFRMQRESADADVSIEIKSDFLVSAVGQLNQPKWPEIEGITEFAGKKMHSARWDWSYDPRDKKIALLGNGKASASDDMISLCLLAA